MKILAIAVPLAALMTAAGAHAADITLTYDITASDFGGGVALPAPVDPVILDFSVTFDPSVVTGPTTVGLDVRSFNLPDSLEFTYAPGDVLTVATHPVFNGCDSPALSLCAFIDPFSTRGALFVQQSTSDGSSYVAKSITFSTGVPEAATWSMMILGLGLAGAMLRRRDEVIAS